MTSQINLGKIDMKIEKALSNCEEDTTFLTQQINAETEKYGRAYPFAFYIRDDEKKIIAGVNGFVIYGAIYTDQLWVSKAFRKQGLGRELMAQVHAFGQSEGCKMATVQTMTFQGAENFYQSLGYEIDFVRPGYVSGSSCLFLRKNF